MHIDTSSKLYERTHTGIAYKITPDKQHKGLALHIRLKKSLEHELSADYDYPRVYAICIYYLIKDDLDKFDILIICGDEDIKKVKEYLEILFLEEQNFHQKNVIGIGELRELLGKPGLKSYADNVARSYRRRALKSASRQQKGRPLNIVKVTFEMIRIKWIEIYQKMKKVSGE